MVELWGQYQKPVKWRSQPYRDFISGYPCVFPDCENPVPPSDPHHEGPDGGTATKASDVYLLPACHSCHVKYHNGELSLKKVDVQAKQLYYLNMFLNK